MLASFLEIMIKSSIRSFKFSLSSAKHTLNFSCKFAVEFFPSWVAIFSITLTSGVMELNIG